MSNAVSSSACTTVAAGGVGESGSFEQLIHTVGGVSQKNIVLRCTASSLCPNTGAMAVLLVNGSIASSGMLTGAGASIQTTASPGDKVVALINAVPLFNQIVCVRLGELEVGLDECDLVGVNQASGIAPNDGSLNTSNWYAWNNKMPPKPDDFHIVGEVEVANPGVLVELAPRVPQGINSQILLMDLLLVQQSGIWPQQIVKRQVRYDKVLVNSDYVEVNVFFERKLLIKLPVETVV